MKKVTSLILAAFLLLAPMTAFSVYGEGEKDKFDGYKFQFSKTAEIYVGGKRVNSKPTGAFTVKWNVMDRVDTATDPVTGTVTDIKIGPSTGTLYATLYEKRTVGTEEILVPLEIQIATVSEMPTRHNQYSYVNKPETEFQNLDPDRAYMVKAVLLDDNLNPCAFSYMPGEGFNCTFFTFDLNDAGSYGDGDGF